MRCPTCGTPLGRPSASKPIGVVGNTGGVGRWKTGLILSGYGVAALGVLASVASGHPSEAFVWIAVAGLIMIASNAWGFRDRVPLLNSHRRSEVVLGWALVGVLFLTVVGLAAPPASSTSAQGVGGGNPSSVPEPVLLATPAATPTVRPTATPSPTPTPTPTAAPTLAPTQTPPPPPPATVTFVNGPLTASPGQTVTLFVRTAANTGCSIEVDYKSGPSNAQGLYPKTSDRTGNVSWTWMVGTRTTPGDWPIYVTCGSANNSTYITVT